MNQICNKENCTACFACVSSCPKNCISMEIDDDLCYRPVIDNALCINCKKCVSVCPNNNMPEFNLPQKVFAGYCADAKLNKDATSGGIASLLSGHFVENRDIVYGAAIADDLHVEHMRCVTHKDVKRIQGSKYVHSHIGSCYQLAEKNLIDGKKVLFIATACQIAGLLNYLGKEYSNLYTIDVVCHGTPDRSIFEQYTKTILAESYSSINHFSFRDGKDYILTYFDKSNHTLLKLKARESHYLNHFLDGFSMRPNCYSCKYAKIERLSDITLGDFWGLQEGQGPHGTNLILLNTEKGRRLLQEIKNEIYLTEKTIKDAVSSNDQLSAPVHKTDSAEAFAALCKRTKNAGTALKRCDRKKAMLISLRHFLYAHKGIYNILKKVPYIREKIY